MSDNQNQTDLKKFIIKVKNLKVGSGLDPSVEIGPLINKDATKKISKILDDAVRKGAKILLGGTKLPFVDGMKYSPGVVCPSLTRYV